jgi:Fe-S oxidoreductase
VDLTHILQAFEVGADEVFLSGCLLGDCHYVEGNYFATTRVKRAKQILKGIGIDPARVEIFYNSSLGMDEEVTITPWGWMCNMCKRCVHACPMNINIPALVYQARVAWPQEKRPSGSLKSCDMALRNTSGSGQIAWITHLNYYLC